jgi:hypothetical protein
MSEFQLADALELFKALRDKPAEQSAASALMRNVGANMRQANVTTQLPTDPPALAPVNPIAPVAQVPDHQEIDQAQNPLAAVITPDTTPLQPMEELLLSSFYSLTKREQLNIVSGFVLSNRITIDTQQAQFKLDRDKQFFQIKAWMAKIGFGVAVTGFAAFIGIFCYSILKHGTMGEAGVFTGLFNTFTETLKIIFSANLG